ncbi:MAG: toxin co-regulated pilus biosynthesis Q family protein, partial [Psychrosphaera sp.]|nr:toxin co-regulated pilus biosynthesis Q family protein [Psychrosphaera sp.]
SRRFRIGETIRAQLAAAAEEEGIALIWQLDRDYIIKHYFEVDSNLISALGTVASALDSDFEKDVFAFYCYRQRAVIITHEKSDYVNANCRLATITKKPK